MAATAHANQLPLPRLQSAAGRALVVVSRAIASTRTFTCVCTVIGHIHYCEVPMANTVCGLLCSLKITRSFVDQIITMAAV